MPVRLLYAFGEIGKKTKAGALVYCCGFRCFLLRVEYYEAAAAHVCAKTVEFHTLRYITSIKTPRCFPAACVIISFYFSILFIFSFCSVNLRLNSSPSLRIVDRSSSVVMCHLLLGQ